MGGIEPAGSHVLELLAAGKPVVTANKQLVAQRGAELFAAAADAGVQLRFEASVCAAIPVIKVLRESLVVTNVHRVLGIVNGTTNFILTEMEGGATFAEALAEAQRRGFAEADPTDDVSGADAGGEDGDPRDGRVRLAGDARGRRLPRDRGHHAASTSRRHASSRWSCGSSARRRSSTSRLDVRVRPALVDRHHPLAAVEGAFNAVMLQGDAIREITLEGPGAGGIETASAVVADMVSVIGTTATGFLQNDACWRTLERSRRESSARRSTSTSRSTTGPASSPTSRAGSPRTTSRSRGSIQVPVDGRRGAPRRPPRGAAERGRGRARGDRASSRTFTRRPSLLPVVSDRGVAELGWA